MITEKFLQALGFKEITDTELPNWYNMFEERPSVKIVPTYQFYRGGDSSLIIFLSPKGAIGEICERVECFDCLSYERIEAPEEVIELVQTVFSCDLDWKPEE